MQEIFPAFEEVTGLQLAEIDGYDTAALNLIAASGLPGTEDLNVDRYLSKLDDWAEQVKFEIRRHLYRFDVEAHKPPTEYSYGNSLGRFFCWYMLQVLQEDCGVAYHPDRKFDPDFCEPQDVFIHGIIDDDGRGGTCTSMPVVYVAVGRRLGFPVFLVQTRGHLFFRWDDPKGTTISWQNLDLNLWVPPERFNVEGSGEGIAYYPDSHYIQWPELWKEHDFEHGRYLRSMTSKEEMADFLVQRAVCWHDLGNWPECDKSIYYALQLVPDDNRYKWLAGKWAKEFEAKQAKQLAHIEEMERLRREQTAKAEPVVPGHPLNCTCHRCREVKKLKQGMPHDHGPSCNCRHCEKVRILQGQSTGMAWHGEGCQCFDCQDARKYAQESVGMPGIHRIVHVGVASRHGKVWEYSSNMVSRNRRVIFLVYHSHICRNLHQCPAYQDFDGFTTYLNLGKD